jgi:hypothetical protein
MIAITTNSSIKVNAAPERPPARLSSNALTANLFPQDRASP